MGLSTWVSEYDLDNTNNILVLLLIYQPIVTSNYVRPTDCFSHHSEICGIQDVHCIEPQRLQCTPIRGSQSQ